MRRRTVIIGVVLVSFGSCCGLPEPSAQLGNDTDSIAKPTESPTLLVADPTEQPVPTAIPALAHTSRPSVSCDPADGDVIWWLGQANAIVGMSLNSIMKLETDDTPIELQAWRNNVVRALEQSEASLGEPPDCLWEAEMPIRRMALTTQNIFGDDAERAKEEIVTSAAEFLDIVDAKGLESIFFPELLAYFGLD